MVKFVMSAFLVAAMAHVEEQLAVLSAVTGAPSEAEPPIHDASANMRGRMLSAYYDKQVKERYRAAREKRLEAEKNDLLWAKKMEKDNGKRADGMEYCEKDAKSFTADESGALGEEKCACFTHDNCDVASERCDYKSGCQKDSDNLLMVSQNGSNCKERCTKASGYTGYTCYPKRAEEGENIGTDNGQTCCTDCKKSGCARSWGYSSDYWCYVKKKNEDDKPWDYCENYGRGKRFLCAVDVKRPQGAPCLYDSDCDVKAPSCKGSKNGQRKGWCA